MRGRFLWIYASAEGRYSQPRFYRCWLVRTVTLWPDGISWPIPPAIYGIGIISRGNTHLGHTRTDSTTAAGTASLRQLLTTNWIQGWTHAPHRLLAGCGKNSPRLRVGLNLQGGDKDGYMMGNWMKRGLPLYKTGRRKGSAGNDIRGASFDVHIMVALAHWRLTGFWAIRRATGALISRWLPSSTVVVN